MSRISVSVWILLCLCLSCAHLHAFEAGPAQIEVEPYVKGGTIAWDQLSGTGGHKSLVGLGLNGVAAFGRLAGAFNVEKWWVAERLDDDKGIIPDTGHRFFADGRYSFTPADDLRLYPFAATFRAEGNPAIRGVFCCARRFGVGLRRLRAQAK